MKKILLLMMVCLTGCQIKTNISNAINNTGMQKLNNNDLTGAIEYFNKAIAIDADNPLPYYNRGLAKYKMQDYDGAITDTKKAISLKHDFLLALNNLGFLESAINNGKKAIDAYTKAIAIYPNYGLAYYNRGYAKAKTGDYEGAIADFTRAIAVSPADTNTHDYYVLCFNIRGVIKSKINDYAAAMQDIDSALLLSPDFEDAQRNKAILEYQQNHFGAASQMLNAIIRKNSKSAIAYAYLGLIDIKTGYKDIGCGELQKAANLGLNDVKDTIAKYCK